MAHKNLTILLLTFQTRRTGTTKGTLSEVCTTMHRFCFGGARNGRANQTTASNNSIDQSQYGQATVHPVGSHFDSRRNNQAGSGEVFGKIIST